MNDRFMRSILIRCVIVMAMMPPTFLSRLAVADEATADAIAEKIAKGNSSTKLAAIDSAEQYAMRLEKPTDRIVDALIVALDDKNVDVQANATRALAAFGPAAEKAVPALIAHMKGFSGSSDDVFLWDDCRKALAAIGPDAVPFLLEAIDKGDENTFRGICGSLHEIGPSVAPMVADSIVEAMTKLIETESGLRRRLATYALINLGPRAKAAIPVLVEELDDEEFQNQLIAIQALTTIGPDAKPAVEKLLTMIEIGNVSVRGHAAVCLGAIGPVEGHDVLQAIVRRLDDPNQVVRERAMNGLGMMGKNAAKALPQVEKAMSGTSFHAKPEAALTYWRITGKSEKAVQQLVKLMNDQTHELPSIQKLGEMGPAAQESVPALMTKLESDDVSVQIEACTALTNIGLDTPEVRNALDLLALHEDAELSATARSAIKRLDEQAKQE